MGISLSRRCTSKSYHVEPLLIYHVMESQSTVGVLSQLRDDIGAMCAPRALKSGLAQFQN